MKDKENRAKLAVRNQTWHNILRGNKCPACPVSTFKLSLVPPQVFIHPSSVNFLTRQYESPYLVYHEKIKTTKVGRHYTYSQSTVSNLTILGIAFSSLLLNEKQEFVG